MTKVNDLAALSTAVYTGATAAGWRLADLRKSWQGLLHDGLQAACYQKGGDTVIAFRGTNISWRVVGAGQDLAADLRLGVGMNTAYYTAAEDFVRGCGAASGSVVLCGHSLGGAVAQTLGNRMSLPFATFNAPGVGVLASRNISSVGSLLTLPIRTVGMVAGAILDPIQAAKDIGSVFNAAHGLNVCVDRDPVSKLGAHYGEKVVIASVTTTWNLLTQHGIDNVIASLAAAPKVAGIDSSGFW